MVEMIENRMVVDHEWDEREYRIPSKAQIKRLGQAYEEVEYGKGVEDEV